MLHAFVVKLPFIALKCVRTVIVEKEKKQHFDNNKRRNKMSLL